jgi:hypothetical protein
MLLPMPGTLAFRLPAAATASHFEMVYQLSMHYILRASGARTQGVSTKPKPPNTYTSMYYPTRIKQQYSLPTVTCSGIGLECRERNPSSDSLAEAFPAATAREHAVKFDIHRVSMFCDMLCNTWPGQLTTYFVKHHNLPLQVPDG